MVQRKFEVHGEDRDGNLWVVGSDRRDTAEAIADKFREDGHKNVRIVENPN